nr:hypothetical protein [Tanacetum cinerariifolium]
MSRSIGSSSNSDGLVAIISKLENLGRDMKKLKETIHAIQLRCQMCEGPHLDKDCPLSEEVKKGGRGATERWVDSLTLGAVNTWDLLKKAFIQRYCPPSRTTKQLEDIHNFKQEGDESLYQAWEWIMSRSIGSSSNSDGLVAIVSKLENLGRDMKKLKETIHAIQLRCQMCEGPHLDKDCPLSEEVKKGGRGYFTRTDNRLPYEERRPSLKELMSNYQEEASRRSIKMEV